MDQESNLNLKLNKIIKGQQYIIIFIWLKQNYLLWSYWNAFYIPRSRLVLKFIFMSQFHYQRNKILFYCEISPVTNLVLNTFLHLQPILPLSLLNLQNILAYFLVCTDFLMKSHYSLCLPGCPPSHSNFNWNWDRNRGWRELNSLLVMKRWLKDEASEITLPQSSPQRELNNYHFYLGPLAGPPGNSAPSNNPQFEY